MDSSSDCSTTGTKRNVPNRATVPGGNGSPKASTRGESPRRLRYSARRATPAKLNIEYVGELALPALREALKEKTTLEKHLRLQALLKKAIDADALFTTAERVHQWRALEVLEKIGSAEALALVRRLSNGAAAARLTREARVVLVRMGKHK